jgi:TIR domain/HEAT repeats/Protein of unknown function (DUF1566)
MIHTDPIIYEFQRALSRQRSALDSASFTDEEFLAKLSKLAVSVWRPPNQAPVISGTAQIEAFLGLGERLSAFLEIGVGMGCLAPQEGGRFRFQDPDVCGHLAARYLIGYLSGEYTDQGFTRALAALEQIGLPAVPLLVDALGDKDDAVNLGMATVLQSVGVSIVPVLVRALKYGNRRVRRWITSALSTPENANAALPDLLTVLKEDDQPLVRVGAVSALGQSRTVEAEAGLIGALNDENPMVRMLASSALEKLGTPRALRALERIARESSPAGPVAEQDRPSGNPPAVRQSAFDSPRLFLSYAREDAETVGEFRRLLKLAGFDPWIDSEGLLAGELWESRLKEALRSSDFVIGFLSHNTPGGYQERELEMALQNAPAGRSVGTPFVLPCAIEGTIFEEAGARIPTFLSDRHIVNVSTVKGWESLHESLCLATRSAGLPVPVFLRSEAIHDLDHAAANNMILTKNFYDKHRNSSGRPTSSSLRLTLDPSVVEDPITGRMWTTGCFELPPSPWLSTADSLAALTGQEQAAEDARTAAVRMSSIVSEFVARANSQRLGGYQGWRLPTLEEAMSLMTKDRNQYGLHLPPIFSDHRYLRCSDRNFHSLGIGGVQKNGYSTIWVVDYGDADIQEMPAQSPFPFRLVRTAWEH